LPVSNPDYFYVDDYIKFWPEIVLKALSGEVRTDVQHIILKTIARNR